MERYFGSFFSLVNFFLADVPSFPAFVFTAHGANLLPASYYLQRMLAARLLATADLHHVR